VCTLCTMAPSAWGLKGEPESFAQAFLKRPEQVDGRLIESPEYSAGHHAYQGGGPDYEGTLYRAAAGTVCVWHGWCPHNASMNATAMPRLAVISRWNDSRFVSEPVQMTYLPSCLADQIAGSTHALAD
jgi:ectoine hydroxylase-related dioxygenase (phytanoyl-CoA dioxygenase family)